MKTDTQEISLSSTELQTLQEQMLAWLQAADPQIKQSVTGTEKVSADTRLDIYANAYRFRLIEALQDTFPALHTLLGDEDFFNLGDKESIKAFFSSIFWP